MERWSEPTLVATVRAHRGEVTCLDVCGARLATGGGDRALRLWAWTRGDGWAEAAVASAAHRYGVTAARWSPGAVLLSSAGVDGAVRLWCGRTLAGRRLLAAPGAAAVRSLQWAGGGRLLAGHDDGALCIWLAPAARLLARLVAHEGALHALATPARGALLLTACTHGVLKVFDMEKVSAMGTDGAAAPAPLLWEDGAHDLGALCAASSEDGRSVATGGHDARVRLWSVLGAGRERRVEAGAVLDGHTAAVTALSWASGVLASASLDRTARLWTAAGGCLRILHAHSRYLTCVALAHDLRYLITGSNDKTVRMWSLGSLTLDDELEPPCAALAHFGLGDLEGIGPVDNDDSWEEAEGGSEEEDVGGRGARRVWHSQAHAGAINCITTYGDLLATASSDGLVRVFRWIASVEELQLVHELDAHARYPALAADFGASGALLLTAGLDGQAVLWDVQTGCRLRSLTAASGGGAGADGGAGGGGVRDARLSPHRPPLLLLATDDGVAPLWSLADDDPNPIHVYGGHAEAVTCCAWTPDGRALATGAASGELRLHTPPPAPATLHHTPDAHDLGVQSCDFAPSGGALGLPGDTHLLATAGCDSYVKLWLVELTEEAECSSASVRLARRVAAHSGAAACVRWGSGAVLLASGGADEWARVWDAGAASCRAAVPTGNVGSARGGALAVALLAAAGEAATLALGTLGGELTLWRLPTLDSAAALDTDEDDAVDVRFWGESGVSRWLRDYLTRAPGCKVSRETESQMIERAKGAGLTGARLLDDPVEEILDVLGYEYQDEGEDDNREEIRKQLVDELDWLRRDPPSLEAEASAAHALLCPLSHRLLREPVRAADGFTYERIAIHEWFLAAEGAVSAMSRRRLGSARTAPNLALRDALRRHLCQHASHPLDPAPA